MLIQNSEKLSLLSLEFIPTNLDKTLARIDRAPSSKGEPDKRLGSENKASTTE